ADFVRRVASEASVPVPALEALIESALGVMRVESIAEAGADVGVEAMIFGPGDYAASLDLPIADIGAIDPEYPGDQRAYPRSRIGVAAHAVGLEPIDGPYAVVSDVDGLRRSAHRARALGFAGKWVIHPDQIPTCMTLFTPSDEEVAKAERTIAA